MKITSSKNLSIENIAEFFNMSTSDPDLQWAFDAIREKISEEETLLPASSLENGFDVP